jgi:hypothetical protein
VLYPPELQGHIFYIIIIAEKRYLHNSIIPLGYISILKITRSAGGPAGSSPHLVFESIIILHVSGFFVIPDARPESGGEGSGDGCPRTLSGDKIRRSAKKTDRLPPEGSKAV